MGRRHPQSCPLPSLRKLPPQSHGLRSALKPSLDMQPFGCTLAAVAHRPDEVVDDVFRALADPSRRALLDALFATNGQTLSELAAGKHMTRQAVTKHLAVLEGANLVTSVRRGREKLHYLNPVPIHEIGDRWISKYERRRLEALEPSEKGVGER